MSDCNKFDESGNVTNPLLMYTYLLQQGKGVTVDKVNEVESCLSSEQKEKVSEVICGLGNGVIKEVGNDSQMDSPSPSSVNSTLEKKSRGR